MTPKITYEQLVNEFVTAIEDVAYDERTEPHTWTRPEFESEYELGHVRARKALDILVEKDILCRKKVWRVDDWGDKRRVPGYVLTEKFIPMQPQKES